MANSIIVDGNEYVNLSLQVVPNVWIVELVDIGRTQTVTASSVLLAAAKMAPSGATLGSVVAA